MKEVLEIISEKYFSSGKVETASQLERVKVRNAIIKLCDQHLKDFEDVLLFEVMPLSLSHAVSVLNDQILTSKYSVIQVDETLFEARMAIMEGI